MKKIIIAIYVLCCSELTIAQGITQNAEGQSAILIKGTTVSFDIAKPKLSFGINNLGENQTSKSEKGNNYPIGGLNVVAESQTGTGSFLSSGKLVPTATISAFGGYSWSNRISNTHVSERARINGMIGDLDKSFTQKLTTTLLDRIKTEVKIIEDATQQTRVKNTLNGFVNNRKSVSDLNKKLKAFDSGDEDIAAIVKALASIIDAELEAYELERLRLANQMIAASNTWAQGTYWKLSLFATGGLNASGFKRFVGFDTGNLSNSFSDIKEYGGHIGIGLNYQYRTIKLGITYNYMLTNNFKFLNEAEYTYQSATTSGSQTLTEESKITAYSGKYGEVEINRLQADFIWSVKLDSEVKNHLLINPYARGDLFSRNEDLYPSTINVGTGLYLFKSSGKFLGGLYFEVPDVSNKIEKRKKSEDQNIKPALKRLTIGITGTFSIGTLLKNQ